MKGLFAQQGMVKALCETKAVVVIRLCLTDDVMYHVMDYESPARILLKLESRYMLKFLTNKLYLKQKLYGF